METWVFKVHEESDAANTPTGASFGSTTDVSNMASAQLQPLHSIDWQSFR